MAWQWANGPIPEGAQLCHSCDNRACVRPDHLFLGSQADNIADMHIKGRYARGDRHGRRKLTSESVAEMRRLYATGHFTVEGLGLLFGVAGSTVSLNVRGLKWQEAGGPTAGVYAHWSKHNARQRGSNGQFRADRRRTCGCGHRYGVHSPNGCVSGLGR